MTIHLYSYARVLTLLLFLASSSSCHGFTQRPLQKNSQLLQFQLQQSTRSATFRQAVPKNDSSSCLCPPDDEVEEDDLLLEDRREALFAMMGSLWAAGALPTTLLFAEPANAAFGEDAKITLPDVVQGLSDRNNKQCLVEALGTRECMVYREDKEFLLYKGADASVLLGRIQTASQALEMEIPPLVETKQWNKITGLLTGPMGQLSSTMTLLCGLAENPADAKQNSQIVKQDVFAMGTATTNKQGDQVLKYQQEAIQDLATFLKAL
jgi:hypothetical protein